MAQVAAAKNVPRMQKKLCLILDLDHTLVHSIDVERVDNFTRLQCSFGTADILQRKFQGVSHMIKLRPFVREFLREASKLFQLSIYTLGTRDYAMGIASILDPLGVYLGSRIISSEDSTKWYEKSLDVVPDVDESGVLILDDLERVWLRNLGNLILMKKYVYFAPFNKTIMVFRDEDEGSRSALSFVLKVLKEVHGLYILKDRLWGHCDVRDMLKILHKRMMHSRK